jgi:two-component system, sporulation sensor kinase B
LSGSTNLVGQVFLNLLIVLTPIYFYQFIFSRANKKRVQIFSGIAFGLAAILSMEFPIITGDFGNGFIWDLRWVPFVICVLYMGPISGAISGLLLIGYRFTLGGMAASFNSLVLAIILFVAFLLLRRIYHDFSNMKKYLVSIGAAVFTFITALSGIWVHFRYLNRLDFFYDEKWILYIQMSCSYIVGILIYTYFTEQMITSLHLVEKLHKSEKLNIVSELAASIAHEVRNPLTVVRGFIQLSKNGVDPTLQGYMDTAIHELDRAEGIISDYLDFAKPQLDAKNEEFNISVSINEMILLMKSYANIKGITLDSRIEAELYINGDNFKFKQALLNLIKNAIEATERGHVEVTASYSERKGSVIIEVMDTGAGMTKEQLQVLGRPYYTTKSGGTGIGLMVTLRLIDAMGGNLSFQSEVGKGTKATISIKGMTKQEQSSSIDVLKCKVTTA